MSKYKFQTEVGQLLNLMAHSLYSNKEIFVRELISNASDAMDKLNFLTLTDEKFKDMDYKPKINIGFDEKAKTLTIADNGIGMNEQDLIDSIGTIAKSGTKSFIENLTGDNKKDSNLIGQFGVGFYSVFMVANKVEVISKKAGEDQAYKWVSDGTGEFEITPVTKEENGTVIYMHMNDEGADEFLNQHRLKTIIQKYSNHIPFPIHLNYTEEKTKELSEEDKKAGKEAEKYTETVNEKINEATALWRQPKANLKKDDYVEFYKTISHDSSEPLTYIHSKNEGVNEFTTLFYIPSKAPMDMQRVDYQPGVKLYVKRVFITDDDKELLPTYLRFVKGIIDSEDLPLNVSREILQENRILANIKQTSIKKILNEIKKISKDEEKFKIFLSEYERPLKEGVYQDHANRDRILEILKFKALNSDKLISLDEYIEKGIGEQKTFYYLIGDNVDMLRHSPLVESYKKSGHEVILLDDKDIDEVVFPSIGSYKDWTFTDITSAPHPQDTDEKVQEEFNQKKIDFESITTKIKDVLGDKVSKVTITNRLSDSPACIVQDSEDPMAGMAQIMRSMGQDVPEIGKELQINPDHEIIKKLNGCPDDKTIENVAVVLLNQAYIAEGLPITDPMDFTKRLNEILNSSF
jgi:molecular chaperone HtpG